MWLAGTPNRTPVVVPVTEIARALSKKTWLPNDRDDPYGRPEWAAESFLDVVKGWAARRYRTGVISASFRDSVGYNAQITLVCPEAHNPVTVGALLSSGEDQGQ